MPFLTLTQYPRSLVQVSVVLLFSALRAPSVAADTQASLTVYVVNYPLQYFAERIAGKHATVVFPAPEDEDPAFWMPDPATISAYQQSDLILLNGASYAKWLNKVSLPRSRIVNTSAGFADRYIQLANVVTHSHGTEGIHAHHGTAFTTWLDFGLAAQQAKAIAEALGHQRPAFGPALWAAAEECPLGTGRDTQPGKVGRTDNPSERSSCPVDDVGSRAPGSSGDSTRILGAQESRFLSRREEASQR